MPQFLQSRFADVNGRLHALRMDDPQRAEITTTPKDLFVQRHLYSTIDASGARDPAQESAYARLDGAASAVISKIVDAVRAQKLPGLTDDEHGAWREFFYQQMKRVPDMIAQLEQKRSWADRLADAREELERRLGWRLTEADIGDLESPEFLKRMRQNAVVQAQGDPGRVVQRLLSEMKLQVGVPRGPARFLIGSRPVARVGPGTAQHLQDPNLQLWLPLAPDVAVRMTFAGFAEQLVSLSDEQVVAINDAIATQSSTVAAGEPTILERYKAWPSPKGG